MFEILEKYEKAIYLILAVLLAVVIAFSVIDLAYTLYLSLVVISPGLLEHHELLNVFGFFLLVLIGIELLGTVKGYVRENVIHVEIVIILAIIAIARKVILLDLPSTTDVAMIGIGVIIIALCSGYYLLKKGAAIR
jgi:uncharacterized membrane protein (DUF373 family)